MSCDWEPIRETRGASAANELGSGLSWRPPDAPEVSTAELSLEALPLATDFNAELTGKTPVEASRIPIPVARPVAITVPIQRQSVRVRSFAFDPSAEGVEETAEAGRKQVTGCRLATTELLGSTRIRPPRDIIKLEDRLQCLLQPSLEVLLAQRSLEFPFQPFPFQLEGIAFLYPRHSAVLADEMGLGKTMQAITAIRLLLRSGELRRVLLICPKPLVSNWQREFELWAPEIPVLVIEGDQAKRSWQWQVPDVPVRIANYELLNRDLGLFEGAGRWEKPLQFDLVVLDESQRIKNRSSATSRAARAIGRSRNWALTGTPVENSADDLVGIFEFLSPGFLSSEMKPRRMGRAVSDYVLRRTKDQVLTDLPSSHSRYADPIYWCLIMPNGRVLEILEDDTDDSEFLLDWSSVAELITDSDDR